MREQKKNEEGRRWSDGGSFVAVFATTIGRMAKVWRRSRVPYGQIWTAPVVQLIFFFWGGGGFTGLPSGSVPRILKMEANFFFFFWEFFGPRRGGGGVPSFTGFPGSRKRSSPVDRRGLMNRFLFAAIILSPIESNNGHHAFYQMANGVLTGRGCDTGLPSRRRCARFLYDETKQIGQKKKKKKNRKKREARKCIWNGRTVSKSEMAAEGRKRTRKVTEDDGPEEEEEEEEEERRTKNTFSTFSSLGLLLSTWFMDGAIEWKNGHPHSTRHGDADLWPAPSNWPAISRWIVPIGPMIAVLRPSRTGRPHSPLRRRFAGASPDWRTVRKSQRIGTTVGTRVAQRTDLLLFLFCRWTLASRKGKSRKKRVHLIQRRLMVSGLRTTWLVLAILGLGSVSANDLEVTIFASFATKKQKKKQKNAPKSMERDFEEKNKLFLSVPVVITRSDGFFWLALIRF